MSGLALDGTDGPVSRDRILRCKHEQLSTRKYYWQVVLINVLNVITTSMCAHFVYKSQLSTRKY